MACLAALPVLGEPSQQVRFVTFRCVLALPFPAAAAHPDHALVATLGALFDLVCLPRTKLWPIATLWMAWAVRWVTALNRARQAASESAPSVSPQSVAASGGSDGVCGVGVPVAPPSAEGVVPLDNL